MAGTGLPALPEAAAHEKGPAAPTTGEPRR